MLLSQWALGGPLHRFEAPGGWGVGVCILAGYQEAGVRAAPRAGQVRYALKRFFVLLYGMAARAAESHEAHAWRITNAHCNRKQPSR